ncbi:MAG: hypothetical protein L3J51_09910 [Cocleimonas sp.]|nr:hypothetical protein [Cocleimonas sp.]
MKNVIIVVLLLIIGALGFIMTKGSVAPSTDNRINVVLNKDERDLVLDEMRQFLISVQGVSSAITNNDLKKVEELAHKAGMAAELNTPGALLQKIPGGMKKLGFGTRGLFDDISAAAKAGEEPLALRKRLDSLMNNCIACHAAYRLPEPLRDL